MGLREFFTDLAELMQRHGVDVSAENHDGDGVLHFTCVAEVEIFRACAYTPKPEDPKNHLSGAAIERRMRGR